MAAQQAPPSLGFSRQEYWSGILNFLRKIKTTYGQLDGEGNGTPLQYSCLENPMNGGAWWAAVHGVAESDTTERFHFHFSFSCIAEGNGNPLQRSYLENPRDGGAWCAAVYGVAQSCTRLKRLSSSSSSKIYTPIYMRLLLLQGIDRFLESIYY